MIPGSRFSDHRKLVVEAVKHVNAQPIECKGLTLSTPRVVASVVMPQAPETITVVGLVYEAASLVLSPAALLHPDRVLARIYRAGSWHPFEPARNGSS